MLPNFDIDKANNVFSHLTFLSLSAQTDRLLQKLKTFNFSSMKNYRGLFSCLLLIWTFGTQAQYQLVWEEQFEGTSLNTDVWNYETGVGVWNTETNAELQHYRAENVRSEERRVG